MKKLLTFVILSCSVAFGGDVNPKSNYATLNDNEVKIELSAAKKYMQSIMQVTTLKYNNSKIQTDENGLEFIDLCKHRIVAGIDYEDKCIINQFDDEAISSIAKYFIKAKSIDEEFRIYKQNDSVKLPKSNSYDYSNDGSLKWDGVGEWYLWDDKGGLWLVGRGYDSGSVAIFTQKGEFIEVIYRWNIFW